MTEKNFTEQEQRTLLELECQLARLKIAASRQRKHAEQEANASNQTHHLMNAAQIANDVVAHSPLWKIAMLYGRGKQKLLLGAALLAWQILSNKQK